MNKRAQLTFFIILGLLIIFIFSWSIWYARITREQTSTQSFSKQSVNFDDLYARFFTYAESCLRQLTKDGIETVGDETTLLTNYLKLNAIKCFNSSLFDDSSINITPPMSLELSSDIKDYLADIYLKVVFSRGSITRTVERFSFVIPKEQLHYDLSQTVKIGDEEFTLQQINNDQTTYITGEMIVRYKRQPDDVISFNQTLNSIYVTKREPLFDKGIIDYSKMDDATKSLFDDLMLDEKMIFDESRISYSEAREKILSYSFVEDVSRNKKSSNEAYPIILAKKAQRFSVSDSFYPLQWYLNNNGFFFGVVSADINIETAWNISKGSPDTIIGIIDEGIFNNPDLVNNIMYDKSFNFINNNNDINPQSLDEYHGTHVAGLIASKTDNSFGIAGVCSECKIIDMKIIDAYDGADTQTFLNAILKSVANGARIISLSLGGKYYSAYEEYVIKKLSDVGIIFVAAAGNDASQQKYYPAAYDGVISVGATNNADRIASFSNYGSWVDIYAPGDLILSSCGIYEYCFASGTSMSTPLVSGVIGLMKSVDNSLDSTRIISIIQQNSDTISGNIKRIDAGKVLQYVKQNKK